MSFALASKVLQRVFQYTPPDHKRVDTFNFLQNLEDVSDIFFFCFGGMEREEESEVKGCGGAFHLGNREG